MQGLLDCAIGERAASPETVLAGMSDDELEVFTIDVKRHIDAWLLRAVDELDRRQVPERRHVLTARQWLKRFCRMTGAAASGVVASARSLAHMPHVAKVAEAGEIPYEHLRQIVAARRHHPAEFPLHEPVFADIATYLDARDLRRAIEHWRQQVDHATAVAEWEDRRAWRRMTLHQRVDGMWHHEGRYDPESGHVIATALRAVTEPGLLDADDRRTHGRRMVDGLVDVCRFTLDHGAAGSTVGSVGTKPHVTVTVDLDQLTADDGDGGERNPCLPEIDGTPVTLETIRRLACDAAVVRIVLGPEGESLDVAKPDARSPRRYGVPSICATAAAVGVDAIARRRGATPITFGTGPAAGRRPSTTWCCSVDVTTRPYTTVSTASPTHRCVPRPGHPPGHAVARGGWYPHGALPG